MLNYLCSNSRLRSQVPRSDACYFVDSRGRGQLQVRRQSVEVYFDISLRAPSSSNVSCIISLKFFSREVACLHRMMLITMIRVSEPKNRNSHRSPILQSPRPTMWRPCLKAVRGYVARESTMSSRWICKATPPVHRARALVCEELTLDA